MDLLRVGLSAARETLMVESIPIAIGWKRLMEDLLAPDVAGLVWRGRGPGNGRELKRAYSGILGRFFARAYLESFEQITELQPIDGKLMTYANRFQVRRRTSSGDMPDWIGLSANGDPIIAEGKGSYSGGNWKKAQWPKPIRNALEQIDRVEIRDLAANANTSTGKKIDFKGWAVASRWGVLEGPKSPIIIAVDPPGDGEPLDENGRAEFSRSLRARSDELLLRGMGHLPSFVGFRGALEFPQRLLEVKVDGEKVEPGLVSAIGSLGVLPIREGEDIEIVTRLRRRGVDIALVSLAKTEVDEAIRGIVRHAASATVTERRATHEGFSFIPLWGVEEVSVSDAAGPELSL